jgi:uncharacterized protein involved in exopolysaccharide biosynthesis
MDPAKIDILGAARDVWRRRAVVARVAAAVVAVGIFAALFGEVKYSSRVVVVPQTGQQTGGGLQGLAAVAGMAGIDLSGASETGGLNPSMYPMVASSVPFRKELIRTAVPVSGHDGPVTLLDYFTEPGYRPFSLFPFLADYTVGLPRTLLDAVRRRRGEGAAAVEVPGVEGLTPRESECMRRLERRVAVDVNEKNGYIALSATMPEPVMAAAVARRAQELLQDYVTRFKVQKVQADLDFIEERYEEARVDFEERQRALAEFQDSHRDITSALARTRESRLENEYQLAFSLYSELAGRREQARIAVKEDTPVFTVVEPATVPFERAAPKRARMAAASLVAGLGLGVALALALPAGWSVRNMKRKKRG